jgi:hypothetical protein
VRKYSYWTEFIAKVCGHLSGVKAFLGIISLVFVNMNDNLRIFVRLFEKRPYLYEPTKEIINEYCRRNNKKEIVENVIKEKHLPAKDINKETLIDKEKNKSNKNKNPVQINWKDKLKNSFCCLKCCRTSERQKILESISDYLDDNLTIESFLENHIINELKKKKINEKIKILKEKPYYQFNSKELKNYLKNNYLIMKDLLVDIYADILDIVVEEIRDLNEENNKFKEEIVMMNELKEQIISEENDNESIGTLLDKSQDNFYPIV